jgi:hypothetical protein
MTFGRARREGLPRLFADRPTASPRFATDLGGVQRGPAADPVRWFHVRGQGPVPRPTCPQGAVKNTMFDVSHLAAWSVLTHRPAQVISSQADPRDGPVGSYDLPLIEQFDLGLMLWPETATITRNLVSCRSKWCDHGGFHSRSAGTSSDGGL